MRIYQYQCPHCQAMNHVRAQIAPTQVPCGECGHPMWRAHTALPATVWKGDAAWKAD